MERAVSLLITLMFKVENASRLDGRDGIGFEQRVSKPAFVRFITFRYSARQCMAGVIHGTTPQLIRDRMTFISDKRKNILCAWVTMRDEALRPIIIAESLEVSAPGVSGYSKQRQNSDRATFI
jgi:hypothetical protein